MLFLADGNCVVLECACKQGPYACKRGPDPNLQDRPSWTVSCAGDSPSSLTTHMLPLELHRDEGVPEDLPRALVFGAWPASMPAVRDERRIYRMLRQSVDKQKGLHVLPHDD